MHPHDKKIFWGVVIFLVGLAWYAQDTGLINWQPFWPTVVMLVGVLFVVKGSLYKQVDRRKGGKSPRRKRRR